MTNLKEKLVEYKDILLEFRNILLAVTAILAAIVILWEKAVIVWCKVLKPLWSNLLKPLVALVLFLGTVIIPSGSIMWLLMYLVVENSNRIREPRAFLSLIVESTAAISLYVLFWGMWFYPNKLKPWVKNQMKKRNAQTSEPKSNDQAQNINH